MRAITFLDRVWPMAASLVAIGVSYGLISGRLNNVEARALAADAKAESASKSQIDVRERLIRIETMIEERLPKSKSGN